MPNRLVAAVLVITVSIALSGCICGPDAPSSACSGTMPSPEVHNHYYEDDDSDLIVPIGAALVGALVVGVLLVKSGGNDEGAAKPALSAIAAPEPRPAAYVISAPTATNEAEIRLQRMYVQGHLSARVGRCEATLAIARQMARVAPDYYRVYAADPTIARCLHATM